MALLENFLNILFPPRCTVCREFLPRDVGLCPSCEASWPALSHPHCPVCAAPFESGAGHRCADCLDLEPHFERLRATGLYAGMLHDLVVRLKYREEERLAVLLGDRMADALEGSEDRFDLIIAVPLHITRLRERGYNQSVLLARRIAKRLKVRSNPFLLKKIRATPSQATLSLEERRKNLRDAFRIEREGEVLGKSVLLVDDVATTGSTLNETAHVLRKAGAKRIEAVVAARAVRAAQ